MGLNKQVVCPEWGVLSCPCCRYGITPASQAEQLLCTQRCCSNNMESVGLISYNSFKTIPIPLPISTPVNESKPFELASVSHETVLEGILGYSHRPFSQKIIFWVKNRYEYFIMSQWYNHMQRWKIVPKATLKKGKNQNDPIASPSLQPCTLKLKL